MKSKKYKILFIASDNSKSSGAFLSMTQLAKLLMNDFNCEVHVLLQRKGNGVELLNDNNIHYHYVRAFNWIVSLDYKNSLSDRLKKICKEALNSIAVRRCGSIVKKYDIDLIHINTSWTYVGALVAKHTKIPYVWHIREFLEEDQNDQIWDKTYGYKLISDADRIITISKSIYNKYEKLLPSGKMQLIYNGVDAEKFYEKRASTFSEDIINLLITGTVSESKGQWQIIQAIKQLVDQGRTEFHLNIVGSGKEDYVDYLKEIVNDNELNKYITFWGYRQDTEKFYKKMDVACVCSKAEAFGRVTIEAMLSGDLVIGAAAGATVELISDNETGLLYDYGDIEGLADKLLWISQNRATAKEIANAGQNYAFQNMTADKNASNVYHVYEELL